MTDSAVEFRPIAVPVPARSVRRELALLDYLHTLHVRKFGGGRHGAELAALFGAEEAWLGFCRKEPSRAGHANWEATNIYPSSRLRDAAIDMAVSALFPGALDVMARGVAAGGVVMACSHDEGEMGKRLACPRIARSSTTRLLAAMTDPKDGRSATILLISGLGAAAMERAQTILPGLLPHVHLAQGRERPSVVPAQAQGGPLTQRENEVLFWAGQGKTSWEISKIIGRSERTVKFHLKNIYVKLGVTNRSQAVAKAAELSLLPLTDAPSA